MLNPLLFGTVVLCGAGWAGKFLTGRMLLHGISWIHSRLSYQTTHLPGVTIARVNYYAVSARLLTSINVFGPVP